MVKLSDDVCSTVLPVDLASIIDPIEVGEQKNAARKSDAARTRKSLGKACVALS